MTAAVLRPLSLGEILDTSFQVYRRHFAALVPVMLVCYGPTALIGVFIRAAGGLSSHIVLWVVSVVLAMVTTTIATGATVLVISESYLGRSIDGVEALRRAMPYFGRLILASFAYVLLVGIGLLFLAVPGVIIACALMVTWPAIVLESLPTWDAGLGRSWELSKGSRGRIFLLGVLLSLVSFVPVMGVSTLFVLVVLMTGWTGSSALVTVGTVTGALLIELVKLLTYAFFNCALTIMYYDLRVRREGFDLELLATTLKSA